MLGLAPFNQEIAGMLPEILAHAARHASVLERLIGPGGAYPVIGRLVCYRFSTFHLLSQSVLQHRLEEGLSPASVRCALTAVIQKGMAAPDLFDKQGWLQPGVFGFQPELAEGYINTGSLYLCSTVFLPLGLPPEDPFWNRAEQERTSKIIWSGGSSRIDHARD